MRQWRFRQRVERARAGFTAIARQVTRPAPADHVAIGTMWTAETGYPALPKLGDAGNTHRLGRPWFARRWQDRLRDVWDRRKAQHLQCLLALSLAQTSDPAQPRFECRRVHDA